MRKVFVISLIAAGLVGCMVMLASAVKSKKANEDQAPAAVQTPAVQAPAVQAPAVQAPAVQRAPQAGDTLGRGGASEIQIVSLDHDTGYPVLTVRNVTGRDLSWVQFYYNVFDSTGVLTRTSQFLWSNGIPAGTTARDEGTVHLRYGETIKLTNVKIR